MSILPVSSLQTFEAVARNRSFRVAAEELSISASAVSHAIRKLEDLIGSALFERHGRVIELTSTGQSLYSRVGRAFDDLREGMELADGRASNLLRLHCAPGMAAQWLTPRLTRLAKDLPELEIRLSSSSLSYRFHGDDMDIDISYGPPKGEGLISIPLGLETVCPLCTPEIASRIRLVSDLLDYDLIDSELKRVQWEDWFAANGLSGPARRSFRFERSYMSISAAVNGLGVALESLRLVERELESGQLVALLQGKSSDIQYHGHYLVVPSSSKSRRSVRQFCAWLTNELGLPNPLDNGDAATAAARLEMSAG
ncbi:LysR substrate-binding domain-containing protein [Neorhizobium sp. JUb45]|uniref:LysR substrate-binding domain-containing protein n=1 Tax=Neorhizobium sp. JUb45 TaxID=2485113 RepID=UPI00104888DB|nr:LysR substrate-binding domain-containing protein [Neorhizobium sp. JUb45]TCR02578.1 DNA-binding transcriptional LysR family regulator [Neorhizobium sp. JUb45]